MENQDLDLIGQTVGNMPYKIGIVDKDGKVTNQFVVNASTNRIDIPQSSLGTGSGGVTQLPSTFNLFSGSAVGNVLLLGVAPNYDNVQDGLLITLSNMTSERPVNDTGRVRVDLSSVGLKTIKIPKEKLIVGNSFDISDQLSQYIGNPVVEQFYNYVNNAWENQTDSSGNVGVDNIVSFETTIKVLPNATLNMNLTVHTKGMLGGDFPIPVIQVNTYKN